MREVKREDRQPKGNQFNKSVYLGGSPLYGYENKNKEWSINKDEEKWVKWIFNAYDNGQSTVEIKNKLDKENVQPRRTKSGLWNLGTLQKMLRNNLYRHSYSSKKVNRDFFEVPKNYSHSIQQSAEVIR